MALVHAVSCLAIIDMVRFTSGLLVCRSCLPTPWTAASMLCCSCQASRLCLQSISHASNYSVVLLAVHLMHMCLC